MSINLPSMLSFERKLETSDALMFSGEWSNITSAEKWKDIQITKRQNRSTQSAHGTKDEDKIKPNPVSSNSDDANLPLQHDTLKVSFSMRVVGNLGVPFGCNLPAFGNSIKTKVMEFKQSAGI
ncbi:MAG: type I-F CRISPR-associated protein Cas7f/Csy3, partial [Shewanella sp.]|uniref:type I-F CRISPR-associated protein Cas7f/Csy3 n=1 Tax=Shewanella sp. TaxID=50422 RepID=UPI003F36C05B